MMILFTGGFYSDDVGYVAKSCKECPNGSFVSLEQAPGTQKQDCKACPEGNDWQRTSHQYHDLIIKYSLTSSFRSKRRLFYCA